MNTLNDPEPPREPGVSALILLVTSLALRPVEAQRLTPTYRTFEARLATPEQSIAQAPAFEGNSHNTYLCTGVIIGAVGGGAFGLYASNGWCGNPDSGCSSSFMWVLGGAAVGAVVGVMIGGMIPRASRAGLRL